MSRCPKNKMFSRLQEKMPRHLPAREIFLRQGRHIAALSADAKSQKMPPGLVFPGEQGLTQNSNASHDNHQYHHDYEIYVKSFCDNNHHIDHDDLKRPPPCVFKIKSTHPEKIIKPIDDDYTIPNSDFQFKKYRNIQDKLRYHHQLYDNFMKDKINPTKKIVTPFTNMPSQQNNGGDLQFHNLDHSKQTSTLDHWREYYPIPKKQTSTLFYSSSQLSSLIAESFASSEQRPAASSFQHYDAFQIPHQ